MLRSVFNAHIGGCITVLTASALHRITFAPVIFHLVVGDEAARPLREAVESEESMAGEVVVLKDILHVGPLVRSQGESFGAMRSRFWNDVLPHEKEPTIVPDEGRILEVSNALHNSSDAQVWVWMAGAPGDVCAYHWLLGYLAKHGEKFKLVSAGGLPFLNASGAVFYPRGFSEVEPRELVKARRLARSLATGEAEIDGENWVALVEQDTGLRIHEGGKKLLSRPVDFYDKTLQSYLTAQPQKASRVVSTALSKNYLPPGDLWLGWRLRMMAEAGAVAVIGDATRPLKEWEVQLAGHTQLLEEAAQ